MFRLKRGNSQPDLIPGGYIPLNIQIRCPLLSLDHQLWCSPFKFPYNTHESHEILIKSLCFTLFPSIFLSTYVPGVSNFDQLDMGMVALEPNGFTMLHHMVGVLIWSLSYRLWRHSKRMRQRAKKTFWNRNIHIYFYVYIYICNCIYTHYTIYI